MARAYPRGAVWRKPLANLQADEQEYHMRRRLEVNWQGLPREARVQDDEIT